MKSFSKGILASSLSALAIVLAWYIASLAIGSAIILPSPLAVLAEFGKIFSEKDTLAHLGATVMRALRSFAVIVATGATLGILAGTRPMLKRVLSPILTVFKAVPVMSVILIAFFWFKTGSVPVFSAFLMAFPVMFVQSSNAVASMDPKLRQMCDIYGIKGRQRFTEYTLPSLMPSLLTGARQTLSMVWKVVIAAEVITYPSFGVGRALSYAQVNLQTERVFAWTLVAILLTALSDVVFELLVKKAKGARP